jgi:hypothetical protein
MDELPFVDEHRVLVPAPAEAVWRSLAARFGRVAGAGTYARVVGARPARSSGGTFEQGATMPGFAVTQSVPYERVRLAGRHHFSRYALVLTLTEQAGGTLLSARTYASFPGIHGRAYRGLVIGSGAHRVLVGRLLRGIGRATAA